MRKHKQTTYIVRRVLENEWIDGYRTIDKVSERLFDSLWDYLYEPLKEPVMTKIRGFNEET